MPRDPVEQAVVFPGAAQPPRGEHEECQEEADDGTDDRRQPDRDMIEGIAKARLCTFWGKEPGMNPFEVR